MFQNIWEFTTKTYRTTSRFNSWYIKNTCLWDFPRFKAIYVWPASKKEIAICLCKFYVHRRRAVDILVKQCDKQKVDFDDYQSFIYHQDNCPKAIQDTYLDFSCTPDQRTLCDH